MITVDFDRLGIRAGERMLDLGCGFGRHAYEAMRRGASVVACDLGLAELHQVHAVYAAMRDASEVTDDVHCQAVNGDATRLPFPDASFDRVLASEVLEHIVDDRTAFAELARVLRPGGSLAVTIPARLPEKVCWMLSADYHAPAVEGGHVRIYAKREVQAKLRGAGLVVAGAHHAHALHAPYWWLRCAVGPNRPIEDHKLVRAYHRFLCWDIEKAPRVTRLADRALSPVLGKSLVVYATKPLERAGLARDARRDVGGERVLV
jgi:SAM-dependent methyltransferase